MKLFIRKIGLMLLILITILLLLFSINKILLNNSKTFILNKNINKLILGDSHSQYAFNDSILSNTYNLSNNADSYFYSYQKLKEIKSKNKQIDTLILSFSFHNVEKSIDKEWFMNSAHLKHRFRLYLPMLDNHDLLFLFKSNPIDFLSNLFTQIYFPFYLFTKGKNIYGGYGKLSDNNLLSELEKQKKNLLNKESNFEESLIEKKYLKKINKFCIDNKIKLILVNPPIYKTLFNKQNNFYMFYSKYFLDVTFLDYSTLNMSDDCYRDLVHLTPKGAMYFSELVKEKGFVNLEIK